VYNVGGGAETTNIEVVQSLCSLIDAALGADPELRAAFPSSPAASGRTAAQLIEHVRDRPGHDRRYAIDYRKAAAELGYEPSRDLGRGLSETLNWYLGHRSWWESLLGRDYSAWVDDNYGRR
jgi:dTDP-glucose 4,6-dehydratase